jgi:hypothetical protein
MMALRDAWTPAGELAARRNLNNIRGFRIFLPAQSADTMPTRTNPQSATVSTAVFLQEHEVSVMYQRTNRPPIGGGAGAADFGATVLPLPMAIVVLALPDHGARRRILAWTSSRVEHRLVAARAGARLHQCADGTRDLPDASQGEGRIVGLLPALLGRERHGTRRSGERDARWTSHAA